jgi:exodeoxyribonuclease-3
MKIATWNVNSLRVRLPHVLDWLKAVQPDILALQETKTEDAQFPLESLQSLGYHVVFSGQKTYNGVALVTRMAPENSITDIPGLEDPQRRILAATIDGSRIVNLYVPNGSEVGSEKYAYKLDWLQRVTGWLEGERQRHPHLVVLGDFNIAPADRDVYDPVAFENKLLCSAPERAAFEALLGIGLIDSFRRFDQPEKTYTWWDYRMNGFRRNLGLRIDHILATEALMSTCLSCEVDQGPRGLERPSDHAPVLAIFGDATC